MSKKAGSELFGTSIVREEEYILLAKTITEAGTPVEQAVLEINCIDDMLSMMRMESIVNVQRRTRTGRLRKNSGMSDLLGARIGLLLEEIKEVKTPTKP